ncbi:hypothetical protein CHARACLAT_033526 [Characodon lateralis]|uniref:Uncharacterized protein n=1 Tax=Characodon lateralis TaxID=208331 RepID=A0ABU7D2U8_9TELE|nr:hypothetical protein [Characodon lateralis]
MEAPGTNLFPKCCKCCCCICSFSPVFPKVAPWMTVSVLCVSLCAYSALCYHALVTFTREELLNIRQSSLGIFSPLIIDPYFTETLVGGQQLFMGCGGDTEQVNRQVNS